MHVSDVFESQEAFRLSGLQIHFIMTSRETRAIIKCFIEKLQLYKSNRQPNLIDLSLEMEHSVV